MSAWEKAAPTGRIREWGPRETKPTYKMDAQPYGVYHIRPAREASGKWIAWEVLVNTYAPDERGRYWRRVGMALTVAEAQSDADADRAQHTVAVDVA